MRLRDAAIIGFFTGSGTSKIGWTCLKAFFCQESGSSPSRPHSLGRKRICCLHFVAKCEPCEAYPSEGCCHALMMLAVAERPAPCYNHHLLGVLEVIPSVAGPSSMRCGVGSYNYFCGIPEWTWSKPFDLIPDRKPMPTQQASLAAPCHVFAPLLACCQKCAAQLLMATGVC